MKITKENYGSVIERIGLYVIGFLAAAFSLFISLVSLFHTTAVDKIEEGQGVYSVVYDIKEKIESVIYYNDNFFLNILVLVIWLILCFALARRVKNIKIQYKVLFIFLWTFILGTVWVLSSQSAPSEDSGVVTSASWAFSENNFTELENGRYFRNYSFQLGYVLFNEMILRFASLFKKVENLLFLEVLNAFFLAVINAFIVLINHKLFKDERITNITVLLLAFSFAPMIDCVFIYGIFPGMMFAVIALYCTICWLTDNKPVYGILSVLSITLAVMLKSNYLIWMIAIVIISFVSMLKNRKYVLNSVFIVLTVVLSLSVQPAVKSLYEERSGTDLGDSIPYISWIAMGLNETDLAPGWYNYGYTVANFENSNFDADEASRRSAEEIKKRLKYFAENPQYANDFFYLKTVSQWNDTTYQSIWNNVVRYQYKEKGKLAQWACYDGKNSVRQVIDWVAQLVFFGFFVGCVYLLKTKKFEYVPLPLVFLGGFMYQFISEGKSQYIIPYYIVMAGFAAVGIIALYDMLMARKQHSVLPAGAASDDAPEEPVTNSVTETEEKPKKNHKK